METLAKSPWEKSHDFFSPEEELECVHVDGLSDTFKH